MEKFNFPEKNKENKTPYKNKEEEFAYTEAEKRESRIPFKAEQAIDKNLSTLGILAQKAKAVLEVLSSQKGKEYQELHNRLPSFVKEIHQGLSLWRSLLETVPSSKSQIETRLKSLNTGISLDSELRIDPKSYKGIFRGSTFMYNERFVRYREQSFKYEYLKEKISKTAKSKEDFANYISSLSAKIFGETVELAKTISFNSVFLEKGFMVLRTAKYDDYRHGIDEILIDLNQSDAPKVVALIDIKGSTGQVVKEDNLAIQGSPNWNIVKGVNKVIEKIKERLEKHKRERIVKYGIIEDEPKGFKKGPIFEAPIVALPFVLSQKTKGVFFKGLENWIRQINNSFSQSSQDKKDLKIHLKKVLEQAFLQADKLYFQNEEFQKALDQYGTLKDKEMYQNSAKLFKRFFEKPE